MEDSIKLCKPASVKVITDSKEDIAYVRELAIKNGEEHKLAMEGHTYHFDGIKDQGRDKLNTKYLVSEDVDWGLNVNTIDKKTGVAEVRSFLDGNMKGKEMLIAFFH